MESADTQLEQAGPDFKPATYPTPLEACQRIERALEVAGVPITGLMGGDADPPMMRVLLRAAINHAQTTYTILGLVQAVASAQWRLNFPDFAGLLGYDHPYPYEDQNQPDPRAHQQWEQFQALSKSLAACAPWLEKVIVDHA